MRTNTKIASVILILAMVLPVLLVQGCGQPVAEDQGCPSDTYIANATDTISGGGDVDYIGVSSAFGNAFLGGTVLFTPVTFTVRDSTGGPRNNVCLFAYTGDTTTGPGPYWYADANYATTIVGTGPYSARVIVTNDAGVATVFWSTATLPPANPATIAVGSTTYTDGPDIQGQSYIKVYSGTLTGAFNVNWTVEGEPKP